MGLVWNLIEYFKSYLFRRQFRRQFSIIFHVILQSKFCKVWASTSNVISEISVKIAWVFQKLYI